MDPQKIIIDISRIAGDILEQQRLVTELKAKRDELDHAIEKRSTRLSNLNRELIRATNNLHELSK